MANRLTEEQQAVVESDAETLLVSASAGSGKTTVLVERYLRHIFKDGLTPSKVWAVTFTHKAASEMRRRILEALTAQGRFDLMEDAETGPIGTLDSLCERLLRENAIDAGFDPDYDVLGNDDLARLTNEAIKEALAEIGSDGDELDGLEGNLAGRAHWKAKGTHSELLSQLQEFLTTFRNGRLSAEALEAKYGRTEAVLKSWHEDGFGSLNVLALDPQGLDSLIGQSQFWAELRAILGRETPDWLGGQLDPVTEKREAGYTARLIRLGCAAWRHLETAMQRQSTLDFVMQQRSILRLLEESEIVRKRIGSSLRALMVDEAQDLNPLQYRLVEQLRIAVGEGGFVTLVGDAKQSIYGFRQATPEEFESLANRWTSLSLSLNHRSEPGIQRYVDAWSNPVFTNYLPMRPDHGSHIGVEIRGFEGWSAGPASQAVADLIAEGWKPSQIAVLSEGWQRVLDVGSELALRKIESQASGSRTKFHAHLTVRDLAATLRALVDPTDDLAYLTVLRSPMADISLDGIVELALLGKESKGEESTTDVRKPLSQIEWEPESPEDFAKFETFSHWFEPLQKEAGRLPAWQVLSAILAKSGYLEATARKIEAKEAIANARKLLRMATEKPLLSAAEFALEVRQIQDLDFADQSSEMERDENAVTLTTIHSAKGLEFDAVVVTLNGRDPGDFGNKLEIDLMGDRLVTAQDDVKHPYLRFVREVKKRSQQAEANRTTYVAITRAKKRLIVIANKEYTIGRSLETAYNARQLQVVEGGLSEPGRTRAD